METAIKRADSLMAKIVRIIQELKKKQLLFAAAVLVQKVDQVFSFLYVVC